MNRGQALPSWRRILLDAAGRYLVARIRDRRRRNCRRAEAHAPGYCSACGIRG